MPKINVLFEVPAEIAEGLANGTLERKGGVIRDVGNKQVHAWLQEMGEVASDHAGSRLGSQMSKLMMQQNILVGLQVANLGVSVAGSALIYQKLRQVEQKIVAIDQKLKVMKEGQDWIDTKQAFSQLAPVMSSLEVLSELRTYSNREMAKSKLLQADENFSTAAAYFSQILDRMLDEAQEYAQMEELAASYRAWVLSSQGSLQTMAEIGEVNTARFRADKLKSQHASFGQRFTDALADPKRGMVERMSNSDTRAALVDLGNQVSAAHEIIGGSALQLDFLASNNLNLTDLRGNVESDFSGIAVCIPSG